MNNQHSTRASGKSSRDPLGAFPKQFQDRMECQHYRLATIVEYGRCFKALGDQMKIFNVRLKDLDEKKALDLIAKSTFRTGRRKYARFIVKSFIQFLIQSGVAKPTEESSNLLRDPLREDYERYLRLQRGLSERTIFHTWRLADRFLTFRFGTAAGDLSAITAADITAFLQHLVQRTPAVRDKTLSTHLRNFFRYLFKAGKTVTNFALGIPSVAQRYGARLPRYLSAEHVEILIKAVRAETPVGRRNHAMVLLIARLGLRAPEIIAMQVNDIDWRSGEVIVRGKGNRHDRVPLPSDVGEALAEYIQRDRKTPSRALFVTERSPRLPFKDGQVLNNIVRDAFRKTGLKPPAPYVGSHILRHSLATNLVQRGASLEEIGDMLRHRSYASTMLYAKVDIDGLRSIALPWPIAGGAQ